MVFIELEDQIINIKHITNVHFHKIRDTHYRLLIHMISGHKIEMNFDRIQPNVKAFLDIVKRTED